MCCHKTRTTYAASPAKNRQLYRIIFVLAPTTTSTHLVCSVCCFLSFNGAIVIALFRSLWALWTFRFVFDLQPTTKRLRTSLKLHTGNGPVVVVSPDTIDKWTFSCVGGWVPSFSFVLLHTHYTVRLSTAAR